MKRLPLKPGFAGVRSQKNFWPSALSCLRQNTSTSQLQKDMKKYLQNIGLKGLKVKNSRPWHYCALSKIHPQKLRSNTAFLITNVSNNLLAYVVLLKNTLERYRIVIQNMELPPPQKDIARNYPLHKNIMSRELPPPQDKISREQTPPQAQNPPPLQDKTPCPCMMLSVHSLLNKNMI